MSTCRFCRLDEDEADEGNMVKYAVRHYAHTGCLLREKGEEFVLQLPPGALGSVSVLFLSKAGQRTLMKRCGYA